MHLGDWAYAWKRMKVCWAMSLVRIVSPKMPRLVRSRDAGHIPADTGLPVTCPDPHSGGYGHMEVPAYWGK